MTNKMINMEDLLKKDCLHQNNIEIMNQQCIIHFLRKFVTVIVRNCLGMLIQSKNFPPRLSWGTEQPRVEEVRAMSAAELGAGGSEQSCLDKRKTFNPSRAHLSPLYQSFY